MLFVWLGSAYSQRIISGTVSDETGAPLIGVNVISGQDKTLGTITDIDGHFALKVPNETSTLQLSYTGFKTQEVAISEDNMVNVVMSEGVLVDEIVVVGYGEQRKSDATSSISSITGSKLEGLIAPTAVTTLAGRAAGVQINTPTGILGQTPVIRIRGVASVNSGTDPLIVVDGMPIYSNSLGGYASTTGLGDINPADIESYEVLKDGAATAIYGSRGANGVILITTKKGKKGAAKVTLSSVFGLANPVKTFDLLKTKDFLVISNEKRTNRGQTPWAVGDTYDTDWQAAVLNSNAFQMSHSLGVSGGSEMNTYYLSLNYTGQDGIAKDNSMDRFGFNANIEQKIGKRLTLGGKMMYTQTMYDGLNTGRNSLSGNIFNAMRQLPNTPILNPDHPTGYNLSTNNTVVGQWDNTDPVGDNISNIGYVLDHNTYQSTVKRLLGNFYTSVDIMSGLNYKFQLSLDNPNTSGFLYWNPVHGDGASSNGRLQNSSDDLLRWDLQHVVNYNKLIQNKHSIGITAVAEYQKSNYNYFESIGTDLLNEFYNKVTVSNAYAVQESGGGASADGIISYLGRLNYNYDQRYFGQISLRRDGLSKLAPANRWNNFLGYSFGWNIANESFWSDLKSTVSSFKVRYSFAAVGNTDIGTYPYFGLTGASPYNGLNGIAFSQFGNDALTWETSNKTDFGADLGFMNDRLKVTLDYFINDIDNLVFSEPLAPSLGVPYNKINKNIGKSLNKGFETEIKYDVIDNKSFSWTLGANLTLIKNKIVALPNGGADIIGGSSTDINIQPNIIIREGESMNSIYGYEYWGVNPDNGNPVYVKADGSLVQGNVADSKYYLFDEANPGTLGEVSSLSAATDRKILGNTLPTYFGGISSDMNYKNFDLKFLVRFSGGNKIFNATRRDLMNMNLNNNSTEILGRWQSIENPGDGQTPILWASSNTFVNLTSSASTRFLEDGDFINLDNISLGYSLPSDLTKKVNINRLRFFIQGQNMLIITKYKGLNPEMETLGVDLNGTPRAKIVSFGLSVGF